MNVKALMAIGNDSKIGKLHNIVVTPYNQDHMVIPRKLYSSLESTIQRIIISNNIQDKKFIIDTKIKDDEYNLCDDLRSLGLSIAIGIGAYLNDWAEKWENAWKDWCFTGEVDDSHGKIVAIGSVKAKLEVTANDNKIKYIMIPSENRQEAVNWAESKGICLEENIGANIQIADNKEDSSFLSSVWLLATKNTLTQIALVICLLSITYLPIRYLLWDDVQSLGKDGSHIIINLPIKNPGKTKERLLNYGFMKNQIKDTPLLRLSKRLAKTNQTGRVLITNKNGVIEFEIINPRDWTLISSYICCGYIAVFALVVIIFAIRKNNGNTKHNHGNTNYDSILLTDKNKEIMFVDNIKQAEAIVEHKIHCTTEF